MRKIFLGCKLLSVEKKRIITDAFDRLINYYTQRANKSQADGLA